MKHFSLVMVFAALTAFINADTAQAQQRGSFVIRNPTSNTLHYQIKWGNGSWKNHSVKPGFKRAHWHKLTGGRAPIPYIRFDLKTDDKRITNQEYKLSFYAVYDIYSGKKYFFKYSSCGKFLDLKAQR